MQQRGAANRIAAGRREAQFSGDGAGNLHNAGGMPEGEGRFGIHDPGEGLADTVDASAGEFGDDAGVEIQDGAAGVFDAVGGQAICPKSAGAVKASDYPDKFRVEPGFSMGFQRLDGTGWTLGDCPGVKMLRDEADS